MKKGVVLLFLLMTFGCHDDDQDDQENGRKETEGNRTVDSGESEPNCTEGEDSCLADAGQSDEDLGGASFTDRGMNSGDWDPCGDMEETSVAWDEPTDLLVTPEEVFGPIVGTCTAPLTWDGEGWDMSDNTIVMDPWSGESDVTVTVEVDEQSVRYLYPIGENAETNGCTDSLEIDAFVSVQTEDGAFDDSADTTIVYTPRGNIHPLTFSRDLTELGGTFTVELSEDYTSGSLQYSLDGAGSSCSGEITMSVSRTLETRGDMTIGSAGVGPLGAWTATGCPLGTTPLEVDPDAIEAMLKDVSFPGVWDDGQQAELNVSITVEGETSCAEGTELLNAEVPGRVTYGTSDGRIEEHTIETTLRVNYYKNEELRGLECHVSDEMNCDGSDDVIAMKRPRRSRYRSTYGSYSARFR